MQGVVEKLTAEPLGIIESDKRPVSSAWQRFRGVISISGLTSFLTVLVLGMSSSRMACAEETSNKGEAKLISKENSVDSSRPPGEWRSATVGQELIVHDRLRTGEDSRAAVEFGGVSVLRIDELTEEESCRRRSQPPSRRLT